MARLFGSAAMAAVLAIGFAGAPAGAGAEPGSASDLASLALDRAQSAAEFRGLLTHWKMPAAEFVFAGGQVFPNQVMKLGRAERPLERGPTAEGPVKLVRAEQVRVIEYDTVVGIRFRRFREIV